MPKRNPPTLEQRRAQSLARLESLTTWHDGPPLKIPTVAQRRAQSRRNAAVSLAACKKRYEEGDKAALLKAINECAGSGVLIPDWAAKAFKASYRAAAWEFKHRSWDNVFGQPHKSKNLHAARQARKLRQAVYDRVGQLRATRPKPRDIFQTVADELDISSARTAKRYFDNFRNFYFGDALYLE
jgi:hypothetical protein